MALLLISLGFVTLNGSVMRGFADEAVEDLPSSGCFWTTGLSTSTSAGFTSGTDSSADASDFLLIATSVGRGF